LREHSVVDSYNNLELFCDTLLAGLGLVDATTNCPPELVEAVHTLIYSSIRVDIKELQELAQQLVLKYGKDFVKNALNNTFGHCNEKVLQQLNYNPDEITVLKYLNREVAPGAFDKEIKELEDKSKESLKSPYQYGYQVQATPNQNNNNNNGDPNPMSPPLFPVTTNTDPTTYELYPQLGDLRIPQMPPLRPIEPSAPPEIAYQPTHSDASDAELQAGIKLLSLNKQ